MICLRSKLLLRSVTFSWTLISVIALTVLWMQLSSSHKRLIFSFRIQTAQTRSFYIMLFTVAFWVKIRLFCVWLHLKLQLYCFLAVKQLILNFISHWIFQRTWSQESQSVARLISFYRLLMLLFEMRFSCSIATALSLLIVYFINYDFLSNYLTESHFY